jgi:hypothetical protein
MKTPASMQQDIKSYGGPGCKRIKYMIYANEVQIINQPGFSISADL